MGCVLSASYGWGEGVGCLCPWGEGVGVFELVNGLRGFESGERGRGGRCVESVGVKCVVDLELNGLGLSRQSVRWAASLLSLASVER